MVADNLPACTKYAQVLQGCPGGHPRAPMPVASAAQQRAIRTALGGLRAARGAAK
jgi:4-hydroxy-tetrahydrodipicolinate synthase